MPPSPLLSARSTNTRYLTTTTSISAQKNSESTPNTFVGSSCRRDRVIACALVARQALAHRVERRRADVAVDHAERAEREPSRALCGSLGP